MNFNEMSTNEIKSYAKELGIKFTNISREKLIDKIKEFEEKSNEVSSVISANDDDFTAPVKTETVSEKPVEKKSLLSSIEEAIDELDESEQEFYDTSFTPLPPDAVIPVKSITYGALIYKSTKTSATTVWNKIGSIQNMTIAEITEMMNTSPVFLTQPNVILLNETAMKQFRLTKIYEDVAKISNLKELFKKSNSEIEIAIQNAIEANMRDVLIAKVRTMYANKTLTDINVISILEDKLQFDLVEK